MYAAAQRSLLAAQTHSHPNDSHQLESMFIKKCFTSGRLGDCSPVCGSVPETFAFSERLLVTADCAEGFNSFLEKRPAKFPMTAADVDVGDMDLASKWRGRLASRSKL